MLENIPNQLFQANNSESDVSIIIGENGSGKSSLLGHLAKYHVEHRKTVVGIANAIHDKFNLRRPNFFSLKARVGRRLASDTVKRAINIVAENNDDQGLRNAARALEYIGFEPQIGFRIENLNPLFESILIESEKINQADKELLLSLLNKLKNYFNESRGKLIYIRLGKSDFEGVNTTTFVKLFRYEKVLKQTKIISHISLYLSKNRKSIPLLQASSGELSLITSIIFLSIIIKEHNTIILIDEPENSLHPKWQKEYVKLLLDIFYLYQPKIIIATHSPIIVNGAEMYSSNPRIYKASNFKFSLKLKEAKNIEETYFEFFDIFTPENRFFSNLLIKDINLLAEKKINFTDFQQTIERFSESVYDEKQFVILDEILKIGLKIFTSQNADN